MKYRRRLFSVKNPYDLSSDDVFVKAVRENFNFLYKHCPDYRKIADNLNVNSDTLQTIRDIAKLPVIPTLFFKRNRLFASRAFVKVTSSGTSGRFSEIGYDFGGLWCALKMSIKVGKRRKLFSAKPCHYVIMGYKPHRGNRMGVTKTAYAATLFTPSLGRKYVLKYKNGQYAPNFDGVISAIKKFGHAKYPVRFMGFPAYTYFLMKMLDEKGIYVKLPKGSKIMLGGGWKQFYAEQADKASFYALAEKVFGIKDADVVEFFGAVEHPVLYCDCTQHHFHVPAYARVVIRDVDTLQPLPMGQVGLVNLITPMVKSTPLLSVMTDDLGVLHDGSDCPCGQQTPYLEIIGRVAPVDIKTCAAGAADILKNVKL